MQPKSSTLTRSCNSSRDTSTSAMSKSLAIKETRVIGILRIAVLMVIVLTATLLATGIYHYTRSAEKDKFMAHFEDSANQVVESFHESVERNIGAVATLSSTITSYTRHQQRHHHSSNNSSHPSFVVLPDFEILGSHLRTQSGSHVVHYMPVIREEDRPAWEEYAMEQRTHIDESFELDEFYRSRQDEEFGIDQESRRHLQQQEQSQEELLTTILEDGTGYHPKIWRSGAVKPAGDEPEGGGPYAPMWQRSPVNKQKQGPLNQNFANTKVLRNGLLTTIIDEKKAILSEAAVPTPKVQERRSANLRLSQYRQHVQYLVNAPSTFVAYPVFDSFSNDRTVVGILATSVYWNILFSRLLPSNTKGIICVVESPSFNQTFTIRIDGQESTFLGMGDHHDPRYDEFEVVAPVNEYLKHHAMPQNRAYATVSLSDKTQYTLRVFPSKEAEDPFLSNQPIAFTVVVIVCALFASFLFLAFSYVVERRQTMMMEKVIENNKKAARAERELNEFLSHEVRNPLAAAMSACSFVSTAVNEAEPLKDEETRKFVRDDVEVLDCSLQYINDFLRSMLDIHQVDDNKIKLHMAPADVLHDVLEPIASILHKRVASYDILVDCPEKLLITTDVIRLKQVVLNLVRNASKFVERGFLRMRANVVRNQVIIYVEDSGPGIPLEKQKALFAKYQTSLDLLGQGTGIGLSLSKKLMEAMGGEIGLDSNYDSGIEGCPGACFVIQLGTSPVDLSAALVLTDSETDPMCEVPLPFDAPVPSVPKEEQKGDGEKQAHPAVTGALDVSNPPQTSIGQGKTAPVPFDIESQAAGPPPAAATPKDPLPPAKPELPSELSVLFVDDDAVLRKLFMRGVKRAMPSWQISEASSGETALRMCETRWPAQYDLIFLDQYMASVDKQLLGTEAAQAMRTKGITSKICGLSANDLRDAFISAGANDFILKPMPCKVEELKNVLRRILLEQK